jgi:hypothetical protein
MNARGFVAVAAAVALGIPGGLAWARSPERARALACPSEEGMPLFAGGGTPLSNGAFFPGMAFYDGESFQGIAYRIPRGCNLLFVNLDPGPVTNCHQIVSMKSKKGRPLFSSPLVCGPDQARVKTRHLKPRVYPYYCSTHHGMFGLLEVAP